MTGGAYHEGPLLGFDLETTGVNVFEDRIVTCSIVIKASPEAPSQRHSWLINPGIEIPEEAASVHGVTTEVVIAHGENPEEALPQIRAVIQAFASEHPDMALVAFNAAYDLTLFQQELIRYEEAPLDMSFPVIDPFVIDKQADKFRRGSRKLVDVAGVYGVQLENAHNAEADVLAAMQIARRLPDAYPALAVPAATLHGWQVRWRAEQCASLQEYFRRKDPAAVVNGEWPIQTQQKAA
ncbi:exonuclease domain-containing protein [Pseudarthrobacter polychromogenes]|uniref:3'-5' exonuclease n=1 Tax=Pseudarthrobacter polychromogenes TaxID=1676 RepID=A0ABQ1X9L4_9MICC|nr:exonuclease domain-containing protein [Pseudarthrobacter polychromogenes]GGG83852.1 3'-5' exonuclease [Pseudarthrobacter polychromogenes]